MTLQLWQKRVTTLAFVGLAFVVGWISEGKYYQIRHLWKDENKLHRLEAQPKADCGWWPWI